MYSYTLINIMVKKKLFLPINLVNTFSTFFKSYLLKKKKVTNTLFHSLTHFFLIFSNNLTIY